MPDAPCRLLKSRLRQQPTRKYLRRGVGAWSLLLPLLALAAPVRAAEPNKAIAITVEAGARQRFAGFGASLFPWTPSAVYNAHVTPAQTAQMARLIWHDARFRSVRLWFHPDDYASAPGQRSIARYVDGYVKTGRLPAVIAAGATSLLLAPDNIPAYMGDGKGFLKDSDIPNYAALLADFIGDFKRETGILINTTGVLNEPNDRPIRLSDAQWPPMILALRAALDARGLQKVRLVAPESANCGADAYAVVDALKAQPDAWAALSGIATHSYNNAATPDMAARAADKAYWMTEASDNGPEEPGDALRAASLASRFLNDVNHRVTHWIHFIGFEEADSGDNATRILAYQTNPFRIIPFLKHTYYRQLSETFDVGATFRHSLSDMDGEMTYTFGKKPHLNAAIARNSDGTWGIGLSNYTAAAFRDADDPGDFALHNSGYPAQTFDVALTVPELAQRKAMTFVVRRSNRDALAMPLPPLTMRGGRITVPNVGPLDLITLRSTRR